MLKYSTALGKHVTSPPQLLPARSWLLFKMRPLDHLGFIYNKPTDEVGSSLTLQLIVALSQGQSYALQEGINHRVHHNQAVEVRQESVKAVTQSSSHCSCPFCKSIIWKKISIQGKTNASCLNAYNFQYRGGCLEIPALI